MIAKRKHHKSDLAEVYMEDTDYTPNRLLDTLMSRYICKNDAALSRFLGITPPMVAKLRGKDQLLTNGIIVAILDRTDLTIKEVRALAGLPTNWQNIAAIHMSNKKDAK